MAATREKRATAGNKMARLLEAEDEDEFYKTTYGGFNEEEGDDEYNSEESDSDQTDSDISIDENDEVRSDLEDNDEPKRKRRVQTKAYKEPVKKPKEDLKKSQEKKPKEKKSAPSIRIYHAPTDKKSLRKSTAQKTEARERREKEREIHAKMLKDIAVQKKVSEVRRLTQEELLAEAKITEELNRQSLENYQRLELEKKKNRIQKQMHRGPVIRYQSFTMPLIEELPQEQEISVDVDSMEPQKKIEDVESNASEEKCSRSFITFTDERVFKEYFPQKKVKAPIKQYCPVTKRPAKYFDPITQTPYATLQAFRYIREAYAQQLEDAEQKKKS